MKRKTFTLSFLILIVISIIILSCKKNDETQAKDWLKGLKGKFVLSYSGGNSTNIVLLYESGQSLLRTESCAAVSDFPKYIAKWTPDGTKILYSISVNAYLNGWYLMNSDGSNVVAINSGYPMIDLTVSPDAERFYLKMMRRIL